MKEHMKKYVRKVVVFAVIFVILVGAIAIGMRKYISSESNTIESGLKNIGELATQVAYSTEVNVTEASRELFGVSIPFTQSKYIYSYDVVIKAGFDFGKIEWEEKGNTIQVKLPEAQILENYIVDESFKVYHEKESAFRQISLEENNEARKDMKKNAEKNAIAKGILDEAVENAKTILTGFFANEYDLEEYTIEFV